MKDKFIELERVKSRMKELEAALFGDLSGDEKSQYLALLKTYSEIRAEMEATSGNAR